MAALVSPFGSRPTTPFDLSTLGPDWSIQDASSSSAASAVFQPPIEQSPNDKREYRLIRLANGLEALLVSDPKLDKAAASLSVGIGHLNDPDDLPGLAHFNEHMLFLGTEKFPDEAAYKTFLSQHAGSSNAFTSLNETNYHFTCHPSAISGALERHSQFFVAPLFLPSCTERELLAVDSEFRRNLMLDSRRVFQLGKATSSREAGAKYWKFGTGSRQTLWDEPVAMNVDVRARLLEWYAVNYSANLMRLVVLSTQTLEELAQLVIANYSGIPNSNAEAPVFSTPALSTKEFRTLVSYRTIKDTPQMRIEFPLSDQEPLWRTRPGRYIGHMIGHEGPGSILSVLKERGWANGLSAQSGGGAPGFDFFRIFIELTALGLENYREVLQIVFAYIDLARSAGVQQWIFDETKSLAEISWRWKEQGQPASVVQDLASSLHLPIPREKIFVGRRIATEFHPTLIRSCFDELSEGRCRVLLGSKDPLPGATWDLTEQYYSTEHSISPLDPVSRTPVNGLHLPAPNPFIPSNLALVPRDSPKEPTKRPSLIRQTPSSRLFFKKDDTWLVPRARAHFLLKSSLAEDTALAAVKTQLFADLVEESLVDTTYDATLAGLGFSVGTDPVGFEITVGGYSEKLPVLLGIVLDRIKSLAFTETQFKIVHERLRRNYANSAFENPANTAEQTLKHLLAQTHWSNDERLSDVMKHAGSLIAELQVDALVHGNVTKFDAITMMELLEAKLSFRAADPSRNDFHRSLVIPNGANLVHRPAVPSAENVNSASIVYYQVTHSSDRDLHARLYLFGQLAKVPVFSTLRTKEQLGYIVQSGTRLSRGMAGFRVIVQSEHPGEFLEERNEALWNGFGAYLDSMSDKDFEEQRQSLVDQRLEQPKNLGQETSRYWSEIECGELDFFYREREAAAIAQLTKANIRAFFETYILNSPTRTKISILMRSQRYQSAALELLCKALTETLAGEAADAARALCASKPTLDALRVFVRNQMGDVPPEMVEKELSKLGEPAALPDGVEEILDGEAFRRSLERSAPALPVDDFLSDLISHL